MDYLVCKNNGYTKQVKPPGLTPIGTLANIFFCSARHMDSILLMNQPFSDFPFPCFFVRSLGSLFIGGEEAMKSSERIGGTFTH